MQSHLFELTIWLSLLDFPLYCNRPQSTKDDAFNHPFVHATLRSNGSRYINLQRTLPAPQFNCCVCIVNAAFVHKKNKRWTKAGGKTMSVAMEKILWSVAVDTRLWPEFFPADERLWCQTTAGNWLARLLRNVRWVGSNFFSGDAKKTCFWWWLSADWNE